MIQRTTYLHAFQVFFSVVCLTWMIVVETRFQERQFESSRTCNFKKSEKFTWAVVLTLKLFLKTKILFTITDHHVVTDNRYHI